MATTPIPCLADNLLGFVSSMEQTVLFSSLVPCPVLQKFLVKLSEIKFDGTVFTFHNPIEVTLYEEDKMWVCEAPQFSIFAYGQTTTEAAHSFNEDFAVLWDEIGQAPDNSLSQDAQQLKRTLLAAVKSVKRDK
jgi:hypothetical protein